MNAGTVPKSTKRSHRVFLGFFILIGLVALGGGLWNLWQSLACTRWPTTEGIIASAELSSHSGDDETLYSADITYSYAVAGTHYTSTRVAVCEMQASAQYAQAILNRFPVGKKVLVHYSPSQPKEAVLEPGIHGGTWIFLGVGITFILFGWGFWQWAGLSAAAEPPTGGTKAATLSQAKMDSGEPPIFLGVIFIVLGSFIWLMVFMDNTAGWLGHACCGFFVLCGLFLLAHRLKNKLPSKILMWLVLGLFMAIMHWLCFGEYLQHRTTLRPSLHDTGSIVFAVFTVLVDLCVLLSLAKWITTGRKVK